MTILISCVLSMIISIVVSVAICYVAMIIHFKNIEKALDDTLNLTHYKKKIINDHAGL